MTTEKLMPLAQALGILVRVHTRDDDVVGLNVLMGSYPEYGSISSGDYIQAWRSVRHAIGDEYDPKEAPLNIPAARAAIEAMMDAEPTEEMMSAMWSLRLTNTRESFATCWRSLLRAYLSPNNQDGR